MAEVGRQNQAKQGRGIVAMMQTPRWTAIVWFAALTISCAITVDLGMVNGQGGGLFESGDYLKPGISAAGIVRARGFIAKEFEFTTKDGYKLHIVKATNPLFNNGESGRNGTLPILFIHSIMTSGATYLATSVGTKPENLYERINLAEIDDPNELYRLLRNNPSSKTLPFLAMNFGYECWILDRRGFGTSTGKVGHENRSVNDAIEAIPSALMYNGFGPLAGGFSPASVMPNQRSSSGSSALSLQDEPARSLLNNLTRLAPALANLPSELNDFARFEREFIQTFDPDFWDFSLDEQAYYDTPDAIDFVIEHSGRPQIHTTGYSIGAALILLATAKQPEYNDKIASAVLWAPSLNLGVDKGFVYQASFLLPISQSYSGPVPFKFAQEPTQALLQAICSTDLIQRTLCARLIDVMYGYSGLQEPVRQSALATFPAATSYHELAHVGQMAHSAGPHMFTYNTREKNIEAYGQPEAPAYKLDRVKIKYISLYGGNNDRFVPPLDINVTQTQLGVPSVYTLIDEPGLDFNHVGFVLHDQADRLVFVPCLLDFKRAEQGVRTDGQ